MDSATMTELTERVQGIAQAAPLYADDCLVGILLVCFFVVAMVLSDQENFLGDMLKEFFLPSKSSDDGIKSSKRFYMRLGLYGVSFSSMALFCTAYLAQAGLSYSYRGMLVLFATFLVAYILKQEVYRAVNWVFFERGHIMAWRYFYSNWTILSGMGMFLITTGVVLFDLCSEVISFLLLIYIILIEICLFFKAFHIFSLKKYGSLQLFVYLCTLEIIPLLLVGKVLTEYFDN